MNRCLPPEYRDFLEQYADDLSLGSTLCRQSIAAYTRKLRSFLEKGFSPVDLCGACLDLIDLYSKGGKHYNPKDHGTTVAALKHLRNQIFRETADTLQISYGQRYSSFPPKEKHVVSYVLKKGSLFVRYQKGFLPAGEKHLRIPDRIFYRLLSFLEENDRLLSPSDTALPSSHPGGEAVFSYTLGDKSATRCAQLFDSPKNPKAAEKALTQYRAFLARIEPLAAK